MGGKVLPFESNPAEVTQAEFPKFLVVMGENGSEGERYLSLSEIEAYRRAKQTVVLFSDSVLLPNLSLRDITPEELKQVCAMKRA